MAVIDSISYINLNVFWEYHSVLVWDLELTKLFSVCYAHHPPSGGIYSSSLQ